MTKDVEVAEHHGGGSEYATKDYYDPPPAPFFDAEELTKWSFYRALIAESQSMEKRKEILANMCDERARMLQDQFNVSMNHVQAMSILISTFHHGKKPSAIDQETFAKMEHKKDDPVNKDDYNPEELEPSPIEEEYAPVIFAQDTVAHVISLDMMSGEEDRENVLRARALGKGVLIAPFHLIKSDRLGVILTFVVYKRDLPSDG
ncbi:hypothetical protein L2E82_36804 [Cichorium intybus]|uniref:Uncharacterized protein n=1 Tax=Cichorium intybus TaxID=13427 RepID=A0ACB9AE36_CICIN|nr:hypothetical protein L2E82_36804 [Cichorium intybus]